MIPEACTLDRVRSLTGHPAFSMTNPNRVGALISSFAFANQIGFNRRDGEGYAFIADIALTLDAVNPQVAARQMTAFRQWRTLEPERRARAEAALRKVAAEKALSRDMQDIVTRTLGA
jgi:aminopeptidase N